MGHIAEALKKAHREREERHGSMAIPSVTSEVGRWRDAVVLMPPAVNPRVELPLPTNNESSQNDTAEQEGTAAGSRRGTPRSIAPERADSTTIGWQVDPSVVAQVDKSSSITEQYRAVRTWLLCRARPNERTCLAVTSSVPREGKTVTAANLAVAMSEIRRMRVLLVDCDLRRGDLAGLLRIPKSPGLAEVLSGRIKLEEAIAATPLPNLWVLPSGDLGDANPTELFNSVVASRVFDEIRERYHYTVVDTPPVHRVSDVGVIGALCTGVVMVVRMHKTPTSIVRQSVQWLQANNLNVMGTIAAGCGLRDSIGNDRPPDEDH